MNIESRIRDLVQAYLSDDHQTDGVRFIDELLQVASEAREIKCTLAGDRGLCFQTPNQPPWEIELGRARTKLRLLSARLAVLCSNGSDTDVPIHGGEGVITWPAENQPTLGGADLAASGPQHSGAAVATARRSRVQKWSVRFQNTPAEHEFTLTAE